MNFQQGQTFAGETFDDPAKIKQRDWSRPAPLGEDPDGGMSALDQLAAARAAAKMTLAPIEPPKPVAAPAPAGAVRTAPGGAPLAANSYTGGDGWRRSLSAAESWIIQRESGFNPAAKNKSSGAFGLWQGLGSTLTGQAKKHGFDPYTTDPNQQLVMFRDYVKGRYGSAEAAVEFWRKHGWY